MSGNPKNLRGINRKALFSLEGLQPIVVRVYHYCRNCGNRWETEIKAYSVTGNMTQQVYDFCTECHKEDTDANKN